MTAIVEHKSQLTDSELISVLSNSLYPGAAPHSVAMVLSYCKASGLDPMQKPVHIVPLWDGKLGQMRDVVMPGIGMYRVQASRSGQFAGMTEPEFGGDVSEKIGGADITYPAWCRVTVKRLLPSGQIAEFTAVERWKENYAIKGGKEKSIAPNAMWMKRPYGQLAKCAEAQALRKAFPEIGAEATAEEMEGKSLHEEIDVTPAKPAITMPTERIAAAQGQPQSDDANAPAPAAPAAAAPDLCGVGEIKYITAKLGPMKEEALLELGIESLEGLTKGDFERLKKWAMEK